jgi:hypothetical protein
MAVAFMSHCSGGQKIDREKSSICPFFWEKDQSLERLSSKRSNQTQLFLSQWQRHALRHHGMAS